MKSIRNLAILVFCFYGCSAFSMNWDELEKEITAIEAGKSTDGVVKRRLIEIVETVIIYTKELDKKNNGNANLLFCLPKGGSMNLDQVVSMIRHQARQEKTAGNALVQDLMLRALEKQFPCV